LLRRFVRQAIELLRVQEPFGTAELELIVA
jgi:hypothetical protein